MIAKEQDIALLTVGNSALKNSEWTGYANYCFDREKGLRKETFKHLDNFLKSTENWTKNDSKRTKYSLVDGWKFGFEKLRMDRLC